MPRFSLQQLLALVGIVSLCLGTWIALGTVFGVYAILLVAIVWMSEYYPAWPRLLLRRQLSVRALLTLVAFVSVALTLRRIYPGTMWDKLDRIAPGMTGNELVEQLGYPDDTLTRQDGGSEWHYSNGLHDPSVTIFDAGGRVEKIYP